MQKLCVCVFMCVHAHVHVCVIYIERERDVFSSIMDLFGMAPAPATAAAEESKKPYQTLRRGEAIFW